MLPVELRRLTQDAAGRFGNSRGSHRSATRPNAKYVPNKALQINFFSMCLAVTATRSTRFSLAADVIAFGRLIHLTADKNYVSQGVQNK
jgi:hypothetical protein